MGSTEHADGDIGYTVYCYDPPQDKWITLPVLPVRWFGLGQINGKLVAVGGEKKINEKSDVIYTYEEVEAFYYSSHANS